MAMLPTTKADELLIPADATGLIVRFGSRYGRVEMEPGRTIIADEDGHIGPGPTAAEIESAADHAALATAAAASLASVSSWVARASEPIHSSLKFEQDGTWLSPDWLIMVAAGQSNALGNANATTGDKTGAATGNVWAWNGTAIVQAALGAAPFATSAGAPNNAAFHAAHRISIATGRPVLLILHAVPGTAIGTWLPPYDGNGNVAGTNWTGLNDKIAAALAAAAGPCWGKSTVDLVLWQQGEAEYNLSPLYTLSNDRYPALLSAMFAASWAGADMQVIVGECLPQASGGTAYQVNEEWAKIVGGGAWPRVMLAPGRGLTTTGADVGQIVHYSGASLQEMGHRMAAIFLRSAIGTAPQAQYVAADAAGAMIWKGRLYARLADMTFGPSNTYNQPVTVPTPQTGVPVVFELDGVRSEVVSSGSGGGNAVLTLTGTSPARLVIWYPADAMRDEPPGISINKAAGEGTLRSFQIAPGAALSSLFLAGHAGLIHSPNPATWPRGMTTFRINGSPLVRFDRFVAADVPAGLTTLTFTSTTPIPQSVRAAIDAENTARGGTITTITYGDSYGEDVGTAQGFRASFAGRATTAWTGQAGGGSPESLPDITALTGISAVNGRIRATNANRNIIMKDIVPVAAGRRIAIDYAAQRIVDSTGGSLVGYGVIYLDADFAEVTPRSSVQESLMVSAGPVMRRRVLSSALSDGVDTAWPAGTVYLRPFLQFLGTDHTTEAISITVSALDHPASGPTARDVDVSGDLTIWTQPTPYLPERRVSKAGATPILYPSTELLLVGLTYGDSTASNRSAGWQDRIPNPKNEELAPHSVMLTTDFAPGMPEDTASPSISGMQLLTDRRMWRTSTAALGQTEFVGSALRFVRRTRERELPGVLRGYTAAGIAGYQLEDIVKGSTTGGVETYARLMHCIGQWVSEAQAYGLTARVDYLHLSIGSNDTAARYSGTATEYRDDLIALIGDLQTDIQAATGQPSVPKICVGTTASTVEALVPSLALGMLADYYRDSATVLPLGPEYQYGFASANHHDVDATCIIGERLAHRLNIGTSGDNAPRVLYPSGAVWSGDTCTLTISDATQLEIDTVSLPAYHAGTYGFTAADTGGPTITDVAISGTNQIVVTFSGTPASGTKLAYAQGDHTLSDYDPTVTGMARGWGNIRNERHSTYNPRCDIFPCWTWENSALPFDRVLNNRPVFHDDWMHNFQVEKP